MAITKRLRYEVLRRDGHRCVYCGATSKDCTLVVDHVVAVALGGTDDVGNLVASCVDCNAGKSSSTMDEAFVAKVNEDAQQWMRAIATAVKIRREAQKERDEQLDALHRAWNDWYIEETKERIPLPPNWRDRADGFLVAGVPLEDMLRLIPTAMIAPTRTRMDYPEWRYFVGCCRNVQRELEGTARQLLATRDQAAVATNDVADAEDPGTCFACEKAPATSPGWMCEPCDREGAEAVAAHEAERTRERDALNGFVEPSLEELP